MKEDLEELLRCVTELGVELEKVVQGEVEKTGCMEDPSQTKEKDKALPRSYKVNWLFSWVPMQAAKGPACCATTKPQLVRRRWQKLREEIWDRKKEKWNISKVPEIYDAVKFDLIHHPELAKGLVPLYNVVKRINDVMVPNEYGQDPMSRARIGSAVCGRLVQKLIIDLKNSLGAGAPPDELPELQTIMTAEEYLKQTRRKSKRAVTGRRLQFEAPDAIVEGDESREVGEKEEAGEAKESEDDELQEAEFASLDMRHAVEFKSPHRKVRTRLYFTSESHIQTLVNCLRYSNLFQPAMNRCSSVPESEAQASTPRSPGEAGAGATERADVVIPEQLDSAAEPNCILCTEAEQRMQAEPVFDYLTQVVFRLYEDKRAQPGTPERHRVEVLFSPGATADPTKHHTLNHTLTLERRQPLHDPNSPLTAAHLMELLNPFAHGNQKQPVSEPGTPSKRGPS